MAFKLKFLGTGTAFSRFEDNYHNNAIVYTEAGPVMIDCGATGPQALHEAGIKPWELAGIVITHLHGDHCGGLEQLIWERYYTGPNGPGFLKTRIIVHPELVPLLAGYLEPVLNPFTYEDGSVSELWTRIVDIWGSAITEIGGVTFTLGRTSHVAGNGLDKPAYGIVIHDHHKAVCYYSGDTTFRGPLMSAIARNASVVFHECMFFPRYEGTVHTHYDELRSLDPDVRAKIVLMHYGKVPAGVDVRKDGFRAAAERMQAFEVTAAP